VHVACGLHAAGHRVDGNRDAGRGAAALHAQPVDDAASVAIAGLLVKERRSSS
jgi:hypothetical protein